MSLSTRRLFLSLLAATATVPPVWSAPRQVPVSPAPSSRDQGSDPSTIAAPSPGNLALTLRRGNGVVELVVQGTGEAPVLQQQSRGGVWQGQLNTSMPTGLRFGPQRMSLPEAGLQSVSITGSGNSYQLQVAPLPGFPLPRPVVSADGQNLVISFTAPATYGQQNASLNLRQPGSVPQPTYAPPLQARAVAPPLGDMAVGSMVLRNPGFVNITGPNVTLTLRNAPAKDALMAIAQLGGYGFSFVDEPNSGIGQPPFPSASGRPVTVAFRNESYSRALNVVLLAAGLQGKREGNLILAGPNVLSKTFGAQVSKVYRLNQASAASAADYLASLGASITKVNVITNTVAQGSTQASQVEGGPVSQQTQTQRITTTETYGGGVGPLKGLLGTTDSRLQTVTLVGDVGLVSVAENYLRQIDLRQRQVALSVKILDVNLDNVSDIDNSFALRWGNNFILNESGRLVAQFGRDGGGVATGTETTTTTVTDNAASGFSTEISSDQFDDLSDTQTQDIKNAIEASVKGSVTYNPASRTFLFTPANPGTGTASLTDELSSAIERATGINRSQISTTIQSGNKTSATETKSTLTRKIFGSSSNEFVDFLQAQIISSNTKVLASPTLILSENPDPIRGGAEVSAAGDSSSGGSGSGSNAALNSATIGRPYSNESFVTVGTQVITDYTVQAGQNGAPNSCQPEFGTAGLTFGARISKIDDNGFVTFSLSPSISASTSREPVQGCGFVNILSVRRLDTGSVRVRDGQTLVLTGVISDADSQTVSKWPILGDIPFIGQFFRSSSGSRKKNELVILVTPRIIDDTQGGAYGYGYTPSTSEARRAMSGSM